MIGTDTIRMVQEYMERASATMFLSGLFQSPPRNFHMSEKVTIDVQRDDEDVAIPVQNVSSSARHNENSLYTNKGFTPPVFKESGDVNAFKLMKRRPGRDPFSDPQFVADARAEIFEGCGKLERKIRRAQELMCSQIFADGTISLVDSSGTVIYSENFAPKATHLVTVSTTWATDGATGDAHGDLAALATVVRRDGKGQPKRLICGESAAFRLLKNKTILERLDNRSMQIGNIAPEMRGQGATFQGFVWIGNYRFEIWMYDGWYKHPQTGVMTPYVNTDHIIMDSGGRLDMTFGGIPRMKEPEAAAAGFLPSRMSSVDAAIDIMMNAWFTPDGENLLYSLNSRPLPIPTAIDTFARLDVTA